MNPIESKPFNFNNLLSNIYVKNFAFPYECTASSFVDKDLTRIITDNSKIITNNRLCKLFSIGPNYHEKRTADYQKTK